MKQWIFRLLLLLPLLAAAAGPEAAVPLSPLAPRKITLVVSGLPQAAGIGYQMAIDKGFYRCRGLDVTLIYSDTVSSGGPGSAERAGDFIVAPLVLALKWRIRDGLPVVHLVQVVNRNTQVVAGWRRKGIVKPESLAGRRLALPLGMQQFVARGFFETLKIRPEIVGQSDRGCIELFVQKRVDGVQFADYVGMPQLYLYGIDKDELMVISLRQDTNLDIPEDGLYCQEDFWQQYPDICQKMRDATQEGWRYVAAAAHREETAAALVKHSQKTRDPMNLAQAGLTIDALVQALPVSGKAQRPGELSPAALQRALDFLISQKMIPAETGIGIADFCRRK